MALKSNKTFSILFRTRPSDFKMALKTKQENIRECFKENKKQEKTVLNILYSDIYTVLYKFKIT